MRFNILRGNEGSIITRPLLNFQGFSFVRFSLYIFFFQRRSIFNELSSYGEWQMEQDILSLF